MVRMLFVAAIVGLIAISSSYGADFSEELIKHENQAAKFAEDTVGLDLHNDFFYYSDDLVNKAYNRGDYLSIKVTMAGQQPNLVKQSTPAAVNPFAVAQTSSTPWGSVLDRWDYKQTEKGYQFFGLYHGVGGSFVVNKVRAQLLRRLANEVQDFLPFLDEGFEDPAHKNDANYLDQVKENVGQIIRSLYAEIDKSICKSMEDKDDSYAAATVVIITKHFVIVVNSGNGRVLGYDSTSALKDLTSESAMVGTPLVDGQRREFGANKSKSKGMVIPDPFFFERNFLDSDGDEAKIQFIAVQSEPAAAAVNAEQTKKIVISQVDAYKYNPEHEQDLHHGVVANLLRAASSQTGPKRWFKNIDFTAMFIALETEYKIIH